MSGKQSKKIRKTRKISKKAVAGAAAAVLCAAPLAAEGGDFLVSLYPHFSFPVIKFDDSLSTGFGGGLKLTYRPTDYFGVFLQGDYKQFSFDTKQSIGSLSVFDGMVGAGYHLSFTDRLGLDIDGGVGFYSSNYSTGSGSQKNTVTLSGFNVGGSISVSYKIGPTISVYAAGGPQHYAYKNSKFLTTVDANPGVTFNITKAFSNKNNVSLGDQELKPVFPVFYSWYNDNSFGSVEICNEEDASITDVTVYFYQQQYMGQPRDCGKTAILKKGEKFTVDLKAFFNENMLNLNEKSDTLANIIVEYKYLGAKRTETFPMIVPVYGRNNMSWEDDRCASAFVSSKDPAAMWFAKYVTSIVREDIRSGVPQNFQYAMAVFEALDQFGINYVKDPTSAFEDNVGTASIDFLQFPYQTLMYRGGDCDDLSILTCSLLESIGIKTAFITIPGHIFMAFDSGLSVAEAKEYFDTLDNLIVNENKVWVPLEITLSDEGFNKAWHKGAWEWNTANRSGDAMIYPMEASWKTYKPVSVPGAAAKFTMPGDSAVAEGFSYIVDEFVLNQITPQIASYENLLAKAPTAQNYNDFGILYARYGLFELADEQFQKARTVNYLPSILNTANLCYSKKDYAQATSWYKKVLTVDSENNFAMLGLARCAYETGDYNECDKWYGIVYKNDRKLARQYSYLGAFESTSGRSFSLADRLENTVWLRSQDFDPALPEQKIQRIEPKVELAVASNVVFQTSEPVKEKTQIENPNASVAVVPDTVTEEEENKEEEQTTSSGSGDGDNNDTVITENDIVTTENDSVLTEIDTVITENETVVSDTDTLAFDSNTVVSELVEEQEEDDAEEEYKGISSQLDFDFLSVQELAELAEEAIIENGETLDDFDTSIEMVSVREDKIVDTTFDPPLVTKAPENPPAPETPSSSEVDAAASVAAAVTVTGAATTGAAETAAGTLTGVTEAAVATVTATEATTAFYDTTPESSEPAELSTTPQVLDIADFIPDVRDALPDLFGNEPQTITFEKEDPRAARRAGHNSSKTTQTTSRTTSTVPASKTTTTTTTTTTTSPSTSNPIKGELKIDDIPSFTDWVPELVEGLKDLDNKIDEVVSTNTTTTTNNSTTQNSSSTSVTSEAKTEVTELVEGAQEKTIEVVEQVETTPTNESLAKEHKKSFAPIYAGFAVLAAALTALFIAKRKKDKKDE
jgi:tetratricopeptide (TPR) repeat protein